MKAIVELLSIVIGCGLIFYGTSKVTANFNPQFHEYLKVEFGKLNKVFPFYALTSFRPYARTYRSVFGLAEIIGGSFLVGGKSCVRYFATMVLLFMHSFALYSLYAIGEPVGEKYYVQGGLTLSLFLLYSLMGYSCSSCCSAASSRCRKQEPEDDETDESPRNDPVRDYAKVSVRRRKSAGERKTSEHSHASGSSKDVVEDYSDETSNSDPHAAEEDISRLTGIKGKRRASPFKNIRTRAPISSMFAK